MDGESPGVALTDADSAVATFRADSAGNWLVEIYVLDLETGQSKQVTNHGVGVPVIGIAWRP